MTLSTFARRASRFAGDSRGTMALTLSQAFLGALTAGIGLSRGVEADLGFHVENLAAEANYAASRVGAGHARASNAIADDNVLSVAAMAPRLAVEADNITMDESAKIACPQVFSPKMRVVCEQYKANKPRAQSKLDWIRDKQSSIWRSLEQLSSSMDKVAGAHAREDVRSNVKRLDPGAKMSFADPTAERATWSAKSSATACSLAKRDALRSDMVGHAFPQLMPNLLEHLPKALVSTLPGVMCRDGAAPPSSVAPSSGPGSPAPSGEESAQDATEECDRIEREMKDQLAFAEANGAKPVFSSDVEPFLRCEDAMKSIGARRVTGAARSQPKRCSFDRGACEKKKGDEGASSFIESLGLSKMPDLGSIGGATRSPSASSPNESDDFRACGSAERSVDRGMVEISDAVRTLVTFRSSGGGSSSAIHSSPKRTSCDKWYFPSGQGTPGAERAFTSAWKHALVAPRGGQ